MQTQLADFIKHTTAGQEADAILRKCVHCGFCTATCPTYQLNGDELDSPRGRIYLIKQALEGAQVSRRTQLHLDRCLTCRNCETSCPSGVNYSRLVDIGRTVVDDRVKRPIADRITRQILSSFLPYMKQTGPVFKLLQSLRPIFPQSIQRKFPVKSPPPRQPTQQHPREMLILDGCVQPLLAPNINAATERILDKLGITLVVAKKAGCCGAISYHLGQHKRGLAFMKHNIDQWWPYIEQGIEAIVVTASGCGITVKEYGEILKYDNVYAEKAKRVSALVKDIGEVIAIENIHGVIKPLKKKAAFHAPCTLQNGLKLGGVVEEVLRNLGVELTKIKDSHLCCGSAGTYSILQSSFSQKLLSNKIKSLENNHPEVILTANIGCLLHLQSVTNTPVKHWIEMLE